jgi:hypothetical protein
VRRSPAALLAASRERIALVPAVRIDSFGQFGVAENGLVEIRNASNGSLVSSFAPVGTVRGLALTGTTVAVLVASGRTKRIERYSITTGTLLRTTWVRRSTVSELDMAGHRILFRTGWTIRVLNARTGLVRRVVTLGGPPLGLSIEGRRVVWAGNRTIKGRERGFVRSLLLRR